MGTDESHLFSSVPGIEVPRATKVVAVTESFRKLVQPNALATSPITAVISPIPTIEHMKHGYPPPRAARVTVSVGFRGGRGVERYRHHSVKQEEREGGGGGGGRGKGERRRGRERERKCVLTKINFGHSAGKKACPHYPCTSLGVITSCKTLWKMHHISHKEKHHQN